MLLLHGQPGSGRDWDGLIAALPPETPAIAIDRPGWDGRSSGTDLAGNGAAALAALDAAGIERAIVVGHSLGGGIAAWLAARAPERVRALVLAAPAANSESIIPLDRLFAAPVAGYAASVAALAVAGVVLRFDAVRWVVGGGLGLERGYLRGLARTIGGPSAWQAFASEQHSLVHDLKLLDGELSRIKAPTVIVAGTADRIVPVRAARTLAEQIPGAELVLLPGAGHLLPQRHGARLAEVVVEVGG